MEINICYDHHAIIKDIYFKKKVITLKYKVNWSLIFKITTNVSISSSITVNTYSKLGENLEIPFCKIHCSGICEIFLWALVPPTPGSISQFSFLLISFFPLKLIRTVNCTKKILHFIKVGILSMHSPRSISQFSFLCITSIFFPFGDAVRAAEEG